MDRVATGTVLRVMRARTVFAVLTSFPCTATAASAHHSSLIEDRDLEAIISETSGALALSHFRDLLAYSGFAPSLGSEQTADYIAAKAREFGLEDVRIEEFPSDGQKFFWAFRTEPWWEGKKGELLLLDPKTGETAERLASFAVHRIVLGRFSRSGSLVGELVDVGTGLRPEDYQGKNLRGKIALASGPAGAVHARAVWEHGASGVVVYRTADRVERPHLIGSAVIEPFLGPRGEAPAFVFSLSYATGKALSDRLAAGETLQVRAEVEAETRSGHYSQVHAVLRGTEPKLPEVWIQAHTNHRNTGGGNNLTGLGAALDLARSFSKLVSEGRLARPRRSIRFTWGPEHMAVIYYLHENPDALSRILAYINLDMVGDHQVLSESVLRLYRTPNSLPSFLNDVVEEMFDVVGKGNSISIRQGRFLAFQGAFSLPIVDPEGSRDPFYYYIEPFWGPSDHEDIAEASLGVHAVLLNTWPDPYIGTQEDTLERADATQMKRAEVIAGASAYILAAATAEDIPALAQNALARARARLAFEEKRAIGVLPDGGLAIEIVRQAYGREVSALESLSAVTSSSSYLRDRTADLEAELPRALARLEAIGAKGAQVEASASARLVPERTSLVRGPVNFYRPEYGRDWMIEKTGDPAFVDKLRLTRRGHYYLYETLNFADGKRNLGEIRAAVGAEYGLAPLEEIEEYFQLLERVGVVAFGSGQR
jgi:hypothetical protein